MTGKEKIEFIAKQIRDLKQAKSWGVATHQDAMIKCPYCDSQNIEGNPLCCELFAKAVAAILVNNWDKERADTAERIMEKVSQN